MSALPPAGWYDDPENFGYLRYWDGAVWTEHRSPTGGHGGSTDDSRRLSDIGTWLGRIFTDIWAQRVPLAIFGGVLFVAWVATSLAALWAIDDLVWIDGEWRGFSASRVTVAAIVALVSGLVSLVVYLAAIHQMHAARLGESPSASDSFAAGLGATPRAIGWTLVLALALVGAMVLITLVAVFGGPLVILVILGVIPLLVWAWVKYSFYIVAAVEPVPGQNPFASSTQVSARGRFWAVVGRLIVLWLVAAVIGWALSIPFSAGIGTGQSFDDIIVLDANDELVLFHVGDLARELGLGGGLALLGSTIPQLLNSLVVLTGMASLYAEVHGRPRT